MTMETHYKIPSTLDSRIKMFDASKFLKILQFIELQTGAMVQSNKTHFLNAIYITSDSFAPCITYPQTTLHNLDAIDIYLFENVLPFPKNKEFFYFQLVHECVHLLSPGINNQYSLLNNHGASVLEEGLAAKISIDYLNRNNMKSITYSDNYRKAKLLVTNIMQSDLKIIHKIRKQQPDLKKITYNDLELAGVNKHLINDLIAPFQY